MSRPAALVVLPCQEHGDEANDASAAAVFLVAQSLEDLRLAERVARSLRATGYPPLRAVAVTVRGRLAILQGRVPSYYMKQVAQAAALDVPGVRELRNDLEVTRPC
jgi:osmotically-inducible protein OsmY